MADLNKVMIIGNVGKDPEMRFTGNGSAKTSFSVAANRNYKKSDGEWEKETEWFNIVTWSQLAERCSQMLQKGSRVFVEGRLQSRSWDGQDGQKHYITEVIAFTVSLQDRRPSMSEPLGAAEDEAGMIDPDDIPFA